MADDPRASVKADLTATSGQISSQVRSIVLGVLAFVWLFLSGAKDIPVAMVAALPKQQLVAIAFLSVLALLFDLLQYTAGFVYSKGVLETSEATDQPPAWNADAPLYVARQVLFWSKQIAAGAAVVWLLTLLGRAVLAS